jgi:hypothetical protein
MPFAPTLRSIARSFARQVARQVAPLALLAGLAACGDAPSEGDCKKLLEHLVELEVAAGGARPPTEGDQAAIDGARTELAKQKKAIVEGAASKFLEACIDKTPRSVVSCSLAAKTLDDVARCDSK